MYAGSYLGGYIKKKKVGRVGFVQGMAPWSMRLSRSHHLKVYMYRLGCGGMGTWESGRDPGDHHNFGTFI
jgi:hypothetical protein